MTSAESAELVQLAQEKGLVNAVNFNIRMYPLAQQARSMVQNGELGDIFILQGSYLQDWLLCPPIGTGVSNRIWAAPCELSATSARTGWTC
jgi:predicted dehydrogenase